MYTPDGTNSLDIIYSQEAVDNLNNTGIDSNYTATYYPWILVRDTVNNTQIYLPPTGEIEKLLSIKPASFNRINNPFKSYTGFIANDLMEVYPTSVDGKKYKYQYEEDSTGKPKVDEHGEVIYKKDENGDPLPRYLSVDNTEILAHVILAFQEKQTQIVTLQAQVAALTEQVQSLLRK
jgi:hypothetical protein